jgi:hypothetical protein
MHALATQRKVVATAPQGDLAVALFRVHRRGRTLAGAPLFQGSVTLNAAVDLTDLEPCLDLLAGL